jgi:apolipoprotein D and lipocalin family protein
MKCAVFPLVLCVAAAAPLLGSVTAWAAPEGGKDERPLTTVAAVDLERYVGLWYEIAKIPNRFQKQCARGTTAQYSLREDGRITVVNRCFKRDGRADEARGVAKIVDTATNAKLEVSFVSFLGWRPFWGDYWIIGLDEDYRWAVIGTPDRKFGWVLSRTPSLAEDTMEKVFAILERNGYDRDAFETSTQ